MKGRRMTIAPLALVLLAASGIQSAMAREAAPPVSASAIAGSPERKTKQRDARQTRAWGITDEEWVRYRELMAGPLGLYSPHLDPLSALGIEAESEAARRRYAELQVEAEARRVGKLLDYQRAYDAAWQRRYPGMARVDLSGAALSGASRAGLPKAGASASTRLAVFVKADCPPCTARVQALQAAGTAFDLYMAGSQNDDARIRAWAASARIDPAKVRSGAITLNHDAGRWRALNLPGDLPAVVRRVNGTWRRQ
jgi:integrating conjugative element protein (TIGR03759 family)